jgi:hypothetical protein
VYALYIIKKVTGIVGTHFSGWRIDGSRLVYNRPFMQILEIYTTQTYFNISGATSISEIRARVFYTLYYEVIGRARVYWLANLFDRERLRKMKVINE